ncbi:MAG: hypothetical protein VYB29_00390 [Candidatus Thermoplasmatota archaeon]|nr:hypothetical protein [Candidatus Thermoplasmatota archaeon]
MGVTAMIPDATIGQLLAEASSRWGVIWDPAASRTRVLMMMPRKERKLYEMHGDMVEHGQPVISIFHRPRAEALLLQEQGLDPRLASFLFVDLASSDLGSWLQHLVTREGWSRSTVEVHPVPFTMGLPNQRRFEIERLLLFRHPDIPAIERYHLPFSVASLAGKCYVSLPARQAAEHARQQAEVLGVGRLERPAPQPAVEAPAPEHAAAPEAEPSGGEAPLAEVDGPAEPTIDEAVPLPEIAQPDRPETLLENVSRRVDEAIEEMVAVEAESIALPRAESTSSPAPPLPEGKPAEPPAAPDVESAPPVPAAPPEPEMSPIEAEFRALIQELMDAGVEPGDMMDDPRWEDLNERAVAAELNAWALFVEMTGQQG